LRYSAARTCKVAWLLDLDFVCDADVFFACFFEIRNFKRLYFGKFKSKEKTLRGVGIG